MIFIDISVLIFAKIVFCAGSRVSDGRGILFGIGGGFAVANPKKIVTDVATRALGKLWRGIRPN